MDGEKKHNTTRSIFETRNSSPSVEMLKAIGIVVVMARAGKTNALINFLIKTREHSSILICSKTKKRNNKPAMLAATYPRSQKHVRKLFGRTSKEYRNVETPR
jgi:hypothetical protein